MAWRDAKIKRFFFHFYKKVAVVTFLGNSLVQFKGGALRNPPFDGIFETLKSRSIACMRNCVSINSQ